MRRRPLRPAFTLKKSEIKAWMLANKISVAAVADALAVSPTSVCHYLGPKAPEQVETWFSYNMLAIASLNALPPIATIIMHETSVIPVDKHLIISKALIKLSSQEPLGIQDAHHIHEARQYALQYVERPTDGPKVAKKRSKRSKHSASHRQYSGYGVSADGNE